MRRAPARRAPARLATLALTLLAPLAAAPAAAAAPVGAVAPAAVPAGAAPAVVPARRVPAGAAPAVVPARRVPAGSTVPPPPSGLVPYPAPARCVDTAGALGPGGCTRVAAVLAADEEASRLGDQVAVAVVPTTGPMTVETWATGLFNEWGVGRAGRDNGVLLVVAVSARSLRIVTGDGMRDRLPDGRAGEIVGGTLTPLLRQGRVADAVLLGLDDIRAAIGVRLTADNRLAAPGVTADGFPLAATPQDRDPSGSGGNVLWLVPVALVGVAALTWRLSPGEAGDGPAGTRRRRSGSSARRSGPRRSGSRSSSRRSFGGGGRSSGGGASGRW